MPRTGYLPRMAASANMPLDVRPLGGDDGGVLLPRLVAAVAAFRERKNEPAWSIAARARMAPSQFSAILKAAQPVPEGEKARSPEIVSADRIADAIDCECMVVPRHLVADVERLIAKDAKKRGGGS